MRQNKHMLGSFHLQEVKRWVPSHSELVSLKTVPALISIIDKLISNAFDFYIKSKEQGFTSYNISVWVNYCNNSVVVQNSGKGITTEYPVLATCNRGIQQSSCCCQSV